MHNLFLSLKLGFEMLVGSVNDMVIDWKENVGSRIRGRGVLTGSLLGFHLHVHSHGLISFVLLSLNTAFENNCPSLLTVR